MGIQIMTIDELRNHFNDNFPAYEKWPTTYEVDHETYANVCQSIFNFQVEDNVDTIPLTYNTPNGHKGYCISLCLGSRNGIMFKNVELILKS